VADLVASLGMPLDEWQEQALEAAMGERSDGRWASKFVGMSVPRQNGKSQLIVARALAGILLFGEKTIIISAHETDTAREVWKRLTDVVEANPTLNARVTARMDAINREYLAFGRGLERQQIRLKARRASGVRGFSADCLLLDEAQRLGKGAWGSIVPTMSAMPNPQMWLFGTPPTEDDDPFAFSRVRDSSLAKKARHCWLEWSADKDDDIDDAETWAKANPAYGIRISHEACADDRAAMDDEQFCKERLGMWSVDHARQVIDQQSWRAVADMASMATERLTLAIDVSPDRSVAAVSLGGQRPDGLWHVALDEHRSGADWAIGWVKQRAERNNLHAVVVDELAGLTEKRHGRHFLKGTDVEVTLAAAEGRDMAMAWAGYHDAVTSATLRHTDQPQVNVALSQAGTRDLSGGRALSKKSSASDITPLTSQTLALWGAQRDDVKKPRRSWGTKTASTGGGGGGWVM
jgi:phage terminase large subunit-like protein